MNNLPARQDLVLVGAGHAHLQVLRQLVMKPLDGLQVTVVSRNTHTAYSGMVPGYVEGNYDWDDIHIDVAPLCAACGANLIQAEVQGLDVPARKVCLSGRPDLRFDLLSINVGSAAAGLSFGQEGIPIRPAGDFLGELENLITRARHQGSVDITMVGSGASGVEVAFALERRLQKEPAIYRHRIRIVTSSPHCLSEYDYRVRKKVTIALKDSGIQLVTGFHVVKAENNFLQAQDGRRLEYSDLFWATPAVPQKWFRDAGLAVDGQGFLLVDENLVCVGVPIVFGAGDAISILHNSRPKAGVFAVRQGLALHHNIYRKLRARPPKAFKPQKNFLSLISLGRKVAIATRGWLSFQGRLAWYWKDWIDRRFLRRFRFDNSRGRNRMLHRMQTSGKFPVVVNPDGRKVVLSEVNHCGACASKLSSELLIRVLKRLDLLPVEADYAGDDAAVTELPANVRIVQSADSFRAMLPDPYLVGRIAAVHALNDLYAMGASPVNALALVTVPWARPELMEDKLFQTLSGILTALKEDEVALSGGHSGEGPELHVGISVTGLEGDRLWQKSGLRDGDALILTKPVGSGVLFAANMRGQCSSRWLLGALETLTQSNKRAQAVLYDYDVQGCTDITGFGLLGHALEMARASACELLIRSAKVPVLEGAEACFAAGVESSLQNANERALQDIRLKNLSRSDARVRVLMDPMTAGGLLAGVPATSVKDCLTRLHQYGYQAACIGEVIQGRKGRIQLLAGE